MTQHRVPSSARAWSVVIAALAINLILGVLYAWGVMGKELVVRWHWTRAEASLPFTISAAAFAITMIFAGRCQDKIGPRYVAMGRADARLGPRRFLLGEHAPGHGAHLWAGRRHRHRPGLLRHHPAFHQVVPPGPQGVHHRHRRERRRPGRRLYCAVNPVPPQADLDPGDLSCVGPWHHCPGFPPVPAPGQSPARLHALGLGRRRSFRRRVGQTRRHRAPGH